MSTNLHMRTGSATHRGVYRENNEDSMIVAGTLCVVADGMGGHEAGFAPVCAAAGVLFFFYLAWGHEPRRARRL